MHGLINRTLQFFLQDTYGLECWHDIAAAADLSVPEFEAMLQYDASVTDAVLDAATRRLGKPRDDLLEDVGTYLVSHPHTESLRRLMRFGGVNFCDFLHSLEDLPDRTRLAVPDLDLPTLELDEFEQNCFALRCIGPIDGFGHVLVGVLRAMADDYGALVLLEHEGRTEMQESISITLIETDYSEGREFDLGAAPVDRRQVAS
ncbi:heme NO-binding domain-containing protein [Puniceibacterium sp. IMCC21224]|uniref:heme NO-binding domain-containing protein n=1 Tax=Puniceibacterium sp. IMCC21224 TaxID=1618204 RepID=UPI00064DEE2B|nr:heme NO-binding domain-containing protein [Puniceibacterium sp. IMCC21224]KMK68095.1 heme NO binding protein [Puniceibacterium sp. IMCC21224]